MAESSGNIPRKVSLLDWGNMDHPYSFGTHYHNGTLSLVVNGLSHENSGFDPRKVAPSWAFTNTSYLLENPFTVTTNSNGDIDGPSKLLHILELQLGDNFASLSSPSQDHANHLPLIGDVSTVGEILPKCNSFGMKIRVRDEHTSPSVERKPKAPTFVGKLSHSVINHRSKASRDRHGSKPIGGRKSALCEVESELNEVHVRSSLDFQKAEQLVWLVRKKVVTASNSSSVEAGESQPNEITDLEL